jgi:hypothetical protein
VEFRSNKLTGLLSMTRVHNDVYVVQVRQHTCFIIKLTQSRINVRKTRSYGDSEETRAEGAALVNAPLGQNFLTVSFGINPKVLRGRPVQHVGNAAKRRHSTGHRLPDDMAVQTVESVGRINGQHRGLGSEFGVSL